MLPERIRPPREKRTNRTKRWRSHAHCDFVRNHACCACGCRAAIEVAHNRKGTPCGMGTKPDDWHTISLCHDCHSRQHMIGEDAFDAEARINRHALAQEFARCSPKAVDIRREQASRGA
ncbi:DUF968 domain-containing protein [Novosphingopyxis sp. YJ-S2-01]|uniref:DUF968 domain-containing protein n=1 Tax=Novosphingopyxis sp. YJ-S2-01 TaxID=2794021 RepID=UPI0018DC3394|nr:DUF968 domain-containing protein [Novosphingopyxis sp. YJ-S2-01]MBH9537489.1 DUF968 domain-containing protein [Novosphingopyxis sp. YJ-S2-01]